MSSWSFSHPEEGEWGEELPLWGAAHLPAAACEEGAPASPGPLLRPNESWGATSQLSRGLRLGGPSLGTSSARMGSG